MDCHIKWLCIYVKQTQFTGGEHAENFGNRKGYLSSNKLWAKPITKKYK